ncbi:N-acetyltransferase [Pantanalinema rosaneae]|uniref:GNAT family N-acetyltransferase n=1 Tax=Pantanalinema rosaneae TaxID=1620701 RepID=UPI003D701F5A
MTQALPKQTVLIRPAHYRDLDALDRLSGEAPEVDCLTYSIAPDHPLKPTQRRSGLLKILGFLFYPIQNLYCAYVPGQDDTLQGMIRVSPFNRTRSTWRVDRVVVSEQTPQPTPTRSEATVIASDTSHRSEETAPKLSRSYIGSQLLRYCFEHVRESRTWLLEVNVNDKELLALYRQNGFQPLAHMTYWEIAADTLRELADREPDLPNRLLPVSNADAQLLYQLDTAAMPPLVRQVFDRHIADFKTSVFGSLMQGIKHWLSHLEVVSGYVFEPQRKAAIGYFQLRLCRDGDQPHQAQLTVHPAYTWLYPELMAEMAQIAQEFPQQSLQLASSDYQPEREEYLERLGANRIAHTLMMSRSVWHKVKESKSAMEALQLSEVLQGFQPARKPVPGRITLLRSVNLPPEIANAGDINSGNRQVPGTGKPAPRSHKLLPDLSSNTDFSEPPQEGPCC